MRRKYYYLQKISSFSVFSVESRLGSARIVLAQERCGEGKGQHTRMVEKEMGGQTTAGDGGWQERLMEEKTRCGGGRIQLRADFPGTVQGAHFGRAG